MTCFGSTLLNRKHAARYSNRFTTFPKKNGRKLSRCLDKVCKPCSFWWICSASCRVFFFLAKKISDFAAKVDAQEIFPPLILQRTSCSFAKVASLGPTLVPSFFSHVANVLFCWGQEKKDRIFSHDFLKSMVDSYMTINSFSLNEWWMEPWQNSHWQLQEVLSASKPLSFQQKWLNILFCCEQLELRVQHLSGIFKGKFWKGKGPQQQLHLVIWCNSPHQQGASWTLRLGDVKFECPQWIFVDNASLDESNW